MAAFFFVWGFTTAYYRIFPWRYLYQPAKEIHDFITFKDRPPKTLKDHIKYDYQERRTDFSFSGFRSRDPDFIDNGYLLISRYSKKYAQTIVQLLSVSNQKVIHTWVPPLSEVFKLTPRHKGDANTRMAYRAQHPLMLPDGDLLFTSGEGPMVRLDPCGKIVWTIDRHFHHSLELDCDGNILAPIVVEPPIVHTVFPIRDDGFAVVSLEGKILSEYSITDILVKNGHRSLVYGVGEFELDRIHLNDAQPIMNNSFPAELGDVALSMRHLSTVALFRPDSNRLIWLKTGPWLGQHDINPLGNGRYSIFGNDIVRGKNESRFLVENTSEIYLYDYRNNTVDLPYSRVMTEEKVFSQTGGRSMILPNGDVIIEESDKNRILRISQNKTRWEYVNSLSPNTSGAIHWARYISSEEIDLRWKEKLQCR